MLQLEIGDQVTVERPEYPYTWFTGTVMESYSASPTQPGIQTFRIQVPIYPGRTNVFKSYTILYYPAADQFILGQKPVRVRRVAEDVADAARIVRMHSELGAAPDADAWIARLL